MDFIAEALIATASTIATCYNYVKTGVKYLSKSYNNLREQQTESDEIFNALEEKLRGEDK